MSKQPDRSLPTLWRKARTRGRDRARAVKDGLSRKPRSLVRVQYQGRMGNRMFQYSLGRRIARDLGFTFHAEPLPEFPETAAWSGPVNPTDWGFRIPQERLRGHRIDLNAVLARRRPREIVLQGYFERYAYYRDQKQAIAEWLRCPVRVEPPDPGDVVLHVRSGDIWRKPGHTPSGIHAAVPLSYYRRVVSAMRPARILLITENPEDPVAARLHDDLGAVIMGGSPMEDYALMLAARRIILSMSTFAWWGAWLSRAEEIHMPLYAGWHPDTRHSGTDLRVTDEDRWVAHDLGPKNDWRGDEADLEATLNG